MPIIRSFFLPQVSNSCLTHPVPPLSCILSLWAGRNSGAENGQCVPMLQPSENSNKKSFGFQFGRRIIPLGISVDPSITGSAGLE